MPITVEKLCEEAEDKYKIMLVAGREGLSRFVNWVHIVEDNEAPPTLKGNELIFTTGVGNITVAGLKEYITHLYDSNISGLVLSIGRYFDKIPTEVVAYCNEVGFPLFTVSCNRPLVEITYDFCHKIIQNNEIETDVAVSLKNAIFLPENESLYKNSLKKYGFKNDDYYIFAIRLTFEKTNDNKDYMSNFKFNLNVIINRFTDTHSIFELGKNIIIVVQDIDSQKLLAIAQSIAEHFKLSVKKGSVFIGTSDQNKGFGLLSKCYKEATAALKIAKRTNEVCIFYHDIGIYRILLDVEDKELLRKIYSESLERLYEYDAENGTDYIEILRMYIENDSSVQNVAQKSYVHRNTINYKIKKIKAILNTDLNVDDKMKIWLSFYIKNLLTK